jgi:hypothetical protein
MVYASGNKPIEKWYDYPIICFKGENKKNTAFSFILFVVLMVAVRLVMNMLKKKLTNHDKFLNALNLIALFAITLFWTYWSAKGYKLKIFGIFFLVILLLNLLIGTITNKLCSPKKDLKDAFMENLWLTPIKSTD